MFVAMDFLRRSFLYRVFYKDISLFVGFLCFIVGQAFFTYKGVETFPFLHYGMYSSICEAKDTYTVYEVAVDGAKVPSAHFFDSQREVVFNTIAAYDKLKTDSFHDPLATIIHKRFTGATAKELDASLLNTVAIDTPYQKWLLQYIADMRMVKNPIIDVYKNQVSYQSTGAPLASSSKQLLFHLRDE